MSNLVKVREALFAQLEALGSQDLKDNKEKLQQAVMHADAVKGVCDTIINSAKLEHNYMRMRQKMVPLTDFMPISDEDHYEIYLAQMARLAKEKQSKSIEALKLQQAQQKRISSGED